MGHVRSKTRSPGQILETYFSILLQILTPRYRLLYIKQWKKGTLKNLQSQVSVPGPSGPSCFLNTLDSLYFYQILLFLSIIYSLRRRGRPVLQYSHPTTGGGRSLRLPGGPPALLQLRPVRRHGDHGAISYPQEPAVNQWSSKLWS